MFEMRGFVVNVFGGEQFVDYVSVAVTWAWASLLFMNMMVSL
jgi:hypothetical protein